MGKNKLEQYRNKFKEYNVRMNYYEYRKTNKGVSLEKWQLEFLERGVVTDIVTITKGMMYWTIIPTMIPLAKLIVEFAEDFMNGELD
ncbi:MAG: hypothetical protein R3Y05_06580 [bacterium]